jgi:hypothetical protein
MSASALFRIPALSAVAVCLMALSGCLFQPPKADPARAAAWDLAELSGGLQEPGFERPKGTIIVRGRVVARHQGSRYGRVLDLAPDGPPDALAGRGVILCLFEEPQPLSGAAPGDLVTVAGFLDRASAPGHLILTYAELVGP